MRISGEGERHSVPPPRNIKIYQIHIKKCRTPAPPPRQANPPEKVSGSANKIDIYIVCKIVCQCEDSPDAASINSNAFEMSM